MVRIKKIVGYLLGILLAFCFCGCVKAKLIPAYNNFGGRMIVCVDGKVYSRDYESSNDELAVPNPMKISGYITKFVDSTGSDFYMEDGICNWISPIPGKGVPYCVVDDQTIFVLDNVGYWWQFTYECMAADFQWSRN